MKEAQIETVGKVFIVVRGMRRCLICDCVLPPTQAANHARTPCYPRSKDSANGADQFLISIWRAAFLFNEVPSLYFPKEYRGSCLRR